jgi:hypothetical protein
MAGLWCMHSHWRKNGHRDIEDQDLVCIYFIPDNGFSTHNLFRSGILVKHQALYSLCQKKPFAIPLRLYQPYLLNRFSQFH